MIVFLSSDLMMTARLTALARAEGIPVEIASTADDVINLLSHEAIAMVIVDLQNPRLDSQQVSDLAVAANAHDTELVAYAQHVFEDLLQSARDSGVTQVYTRGKFNSSIAQVVEVAKTKMSA